LDVGGPAYLLPTAQRDKFYDVKTILKHLKYNHDTLVIGAGAGPWPHTNFNCEVCILSKSYQLIVIFLVV